MLIYKKNLRTLGERKNFKSDIEFWLDFEKERQKFDKKIKKVCALQFEKEKKLVLNMIQQLSDENQLLSVDKIIPKNISEDWKYIISKTYEIVGRYFFERQLKQLKIGENKLQKKNVLVFDELNRLRQTVLVIDTDYDNNRIEDIMVRIIENPKTVEDENNNFWFLALISFLTFYNMNKVNNIITTTTTLLTTIINRSVISKANTQEIIQSVTKLYNTMIETRSATIANTEVAGASNFGTRTAGDTSKLPLKHTWIATMDNRVRDIHFLAHGQTRPKEQPFVVGSERLKYPHDVSLGATARNIVNCRCLERIEIDESKL